MLGWRRDNWQSFGASVLTLEMGSTLEIPEDLIYHHCHFPTGTRRESGSLNHGPQYESINIFEHEEATWEYISKIEAAEDLLQSAWASLLCTYTRNNIVSFVTYCPLNGTCSIASTKLLVLEYQTLNKRIFKRTHEARLERYFSRALRDARINTAIDFSGSLSLVNGGDNGRLSQLLESQNNDFVHMVGTFSITLTGAFYENATRL